MESNRILNASLSNYFNKFLPLKLTNLWGPGLFNLSGGVGDLQHTSIA